MTTYFRSRESPRIRRVHSDTDETSSRSPSQSSQFASSYFPRGVKSSLFASIRRIKKPATYNQKFTPTFSKKPESSATFYSSYRKRELFRDVSMDFSSTPSKLQRLFWSSNSEIRVLFYFYIPKYKTYLITNWLQNRTRIFSKRNWIICVNFLILSERAIVNFCC